MRSSGGIDLSTRTIFTTQEGIIRKYFLVASSVEGQVVGYRSSQVFSHNDDRWDTKGSIYSAIRKKGIATAIDSAHKDFLQRVANQWQRPITWETYNANAGVLWLEEKKRREKAEDALSDEQIKERRVEQTRWKQLWGAGGKLGMNSMGEVVVPTQVSRITGSVMREDLQGVEAIYMARGDDGLFKPVEIERALSNQERLELIGRKSLAFQKYLDTDVFTYLP